jgi:hypothetical protein
MQVPPLFGLRRYYERVVCFVCCRLILLLMGFWSIKTSYASFPSPVAHQQYGAPGQLQAERRVD